MKKLETRKKQMLYGAAAAIIFFALVLVSFKAFSDGQSRVPPGYNELTSVLLVALTAWSVEIVYRIQRINFRRIICVIFGIFFIWIILAYARSIFEYDAQATRLLHYMNFIPLMAVNFCFLSLFIEVFHANVKLAFIFKRVIFVVIVILSAFVLTNDLHFAVITYPQGISDAVNYSYSFGYYLIVVFCFLLLLCGLILFVKGTYRRNSFSQLATPFFVYVSMTLYFILLAARQIKLDNIPLLEDECMVTIIFSLFLLEVCMRGGFIQNRGEYFENFKNCILPLCLTDKRGKITYKSPRFNYERYNEAPSPDFRFNKIEISSGTVIIEEDLTRLNELRSRIDEERQLLERSNELLAHSRIVKGEEAAIKARKELYDEIDAALAVKLKEVVEMVNALANEVTDENRAETDNLLSNIRLRLGYLKQKCMLTLLAKTKDALSADEFKMMADVARTDIRCAGLTSVAMKVIADGEIPVAFVLVFNDFVEYVAERFAFTDAAMFITVNSGRRLLVANVECSTSPAESNVGRTFSDSGYIVTTSRDGDEYRVDLRKGVNK